MKKIFIGIIFLAVTSYSYGQYSTAAGVRVGSEKGINFKQFISLNGALDLWAGFGPVGGNLDQKRQKNITLLYEHSIEGKSSVRMFANTYYIFGGGIHTNSFKDKGLDKTLFRFGFDLIAGVEYQMSFAPLIVGIDIKPFIDIYNPELSPRYIDFGLNIRYIINENL